MTTKYFEVVGSINGETEVLYGSFERNDCVYELDCERETWKADGYKKLKIVSRLTEETPDPEVYGSNDDSYIKAVCKALKNDDVTISVGDLSEDYEDLENSRELGQIREACEATEQPVLQFFKGGKWVGSMMVLVGYKDESIVDYHYNQFMNSIVE